MTPNSDRCRQAAFQRPKHRLIQAASILVGGTLAGIAAALLAIGSGVNVADAILAGGGATGGVATLLGTFFGVMNDENSEGF